MKKYFSGILRIVPKCKECKSYKNVGLSSYNIGNGEIEKFWECYKCNTVIQKAKN